MTPYSDPRFDGFGPFCKRTAIVLVALGFVTLAPMIFHLLQARFRPALLAFLSA